MDEILLINQREKNLLSSKRRSKLRQRRFRTMPPGSDLNIRKTPKRRHSRLQTCFIASSSDANLNVIKALLEKRGIRPFVASEQMPTSASLLEQVNNAISKADLIIAILDPEQSNANTYYELGYAHALGKKILILAPPELKNIPTDIAGLLYLRTNVENSDAINFALDQALAVPESTKHKHSWPILKSQPIGQLADALIEKLALLSDQVTERDIQQIVMSALEASGISVAISSSPHEIGADLAIWDDELDPWIGNPFLIEIKNRLTNPTHVTELLNQISIYLQKSNSRSALVIYYNGLPPQVFDSQPTVSSHIFFLDVRQLLEGLRDHSFSDIIRNLRNRRAHQRDI